MKTLLPRFLTTTTVSSSSAESADRLTFLVHGDGSASLGWSFIISEPSSARPPLRTPSMHSLWLSKMKIDVAPRWILSRLQCFGRSRCVPSTRKLFVESYWLVVFSSAGVTSVVFSAGNKHYLVFVVEGKFHSSNVTRRFISEFEFFPIIIQNNSADRNLLMT